MALEWSRDCGLHGTGDSHAPAAAIAQQPLEGGLVEGGGGDKHLADPGQQQGAERVMDHRLVVYLHQLLAHSRGERPKVGTAEYSQNDRLAPHEVVSCSAGVISAWKINSPEAHVCRNRPGTTGRS